jgi:uncharacterized membrane protein
MTAIAPVTAALAALLNGVAAGIMLSTVVGIVPMMLTQPYQGYVQTVQFLWPRYDPLMPILNASALVLTAFSAVAAGGVPARPVLAVAAALLAIVMTISITKNVPVNRFVGGLDPDHQPADWARLDPRPRWRRWNLIRTTLAVVAFALNVTGTALLH